MGNHVKFTIPLKPKPKQRPQYGRGYTYTPKETREYEAEVGLFARRAIKQPLTGAIRVKIDFYMPIPKKRTKAEKKDAIDGKIRPASTPDIDNLTKAILDGVNGGIAYRDDSLIVELVVAEWYGEPRTEIEMEEL
jgi:Holliday junction resolvase RusA-like endonuclease